MWKLFKIVLWVVVVFVAISILGSLGKKGDTPPSPAPPPAAGGPATITPPPSSAARTFYMGFQPWPYDFTDEAVRDAYAFIGAHGDIISQHLDNGVPWQEALDGKEFPKNLNDEWSFRRATTPKGHAIFLSVNPLNIYRNGLAMSWTEAGGGQPLQGPWSGYRLNDSHVKQAFVTYAARAVDYFRPQYLAIGIEANILISKDPNTWQDYKELHTHAYAELKKKYPTLPIFFTIQYDHLRGLEEESKKNAGMQMDEVGDLLRSSDMTALSTYHYGIGLNPVKDDYFAPALSFKKPIAIAEFGANSKGFEIYGKKIDATPDDQGQFISFVLKKAMDDAFVFVIHFTGTDYDKLVAKIPAEFQEFAKAWEHSGLRDMSLAPKPALAIWDSYLALKKIR